MRLQEVYFICKTALVNWAEPQLKEVTFSSPTTMKGYDLENLPALLQLLDSIAPLEFIAQDLDKLQRNVLCIARRSQKFCCLDSDVRNALVYRMNTIKGKLEVACDIFESVHCDCFDDTRVGFDVKLPPNLSLDVMEQCVHTLDQIFSTCPILRNQDGTIEFAGFDKGSDWLTFIIHGGAAAALLQALAALIDKAVIIRSHILTTRAQTEQLRTLKLKNDILESMVNGFKEIETALVEKETANLAQDYDINDPEDMERLRHSTQSLADLMSKGLEIYAAVGSPDDVKAVFPPLEQQRLSESDIKMLREANDPTVEAE